MADPILDHLYEVYDRPRAGYWVIDYQGQVMGGGGFAPLAGNDAVCELQKMYFLPEARGQGLAKRISNLVELHARAAGFTRCYLETTVCLTEAISLYEKLGYHYIEHSLGNTGHDACEIFMLKALF